MPVWACRSGGGLNEQGRKVIAEMNRLGILIDLSHATDQAKMEIIEASRAPVVGSHHGLRHFVEHKRNLSDEVLKAMAAKGGLMGMHSSSGYIGEKMAELRKARAAERKMPPPAPMLRHLIKGFEFFRPPYEDFGDYIRELDATMHAKWNNSGYGKPWRDGPFHFRTELKELERVLAEPKLPLAATIPAKAPAN